MLCMAEENFYHTKVISFSNLFMFATDYKLYGKKYHKKVEVAQIMLYRNPKHVTSIFTILTDTPKYFDTSHYLCTGN